MFSKDQILTELQKIEDPRLKQDIVSAGLVSAIFIRDNKIGFALEIKDYPTEEDENLRKKCEDNIRNFTKYNNVSVILTKQNEAPSDLNKAKKLSMANTDSNKAANQPKEQIKIPNVKKVILVASGKGGVGKSTIAANIALALAQAGNKVAVVDSDIYGPSQAKMLGTSSKGKPKVNPENKKMIPHESVMGIKSISMANIVDQDQATIWRGPMTTKALYQLFIGVDWFDGMKDPSTKSIQHFASEVGSNNKEHLKKSTYEDEMAGDLGAQDRNILNISEDPSTKSTQHFASEVDFLIVDTPPGTGDVHISLAENFVIDGVVIVTTPQEIATIDAIKAINMYNKLNIKIIGIVENMSYFQDSNNNKNYIFGQDGGKNIAKKYSLSLLSEIPIIENLRLNCDKGNLENNKEYKEYFDKIANKLCQD